MVRREVLGAQNVSRMCMVCGMENAAGLHARFLQLDGDELACVFTPRPEHQGYPGRLHGGIASTVLDETIGRAINLTDPDAWGVTVELTLRYRSPVPIDMEVHVIGRITKDSSRIFEGTGEIVLPDGTVAVEAKGRYMKMPVERIVDGGFEDDWFPDPRKRPASLDISGTSPLQPGER